MGLKRTRFANPIGLDAPGNHSSALDLARIARRVLANDFLAGTVDMPRARLTTGAHTRIVVNRNRLVARVPSIDGVKTGHTQTAGYVLVGAATRKGARLVSVVLGEPSETARDDDTLALLRYGFSQYVRTPVLRPGVDGRARKGEALRRSRGAARGRRAACPSRCAGGARADRGRGARHAQWPARRGRSRRHGARVPRRPAGAHRAGS